MAGWFRMWKDTLDDPYLIAAVDSLCDDYGAFLGFHEGESEFFSSSRSLEGGENRNALRLLLRGAMATLWAYADDHIEDDNSLPMTAKSVDRLVGLEGFHRIVPSKWLQVDEQNKRVILPGFREKNALETKTKKREANAERQRRYRERQRDGVTDDSNAESNADRNAESNARNAPKTKTKTKTKKEGVSAWGESAEGVDPEAWNEWASYKRGKPADQTVTKTANFLAAYPPDVQRQIVSNSIRNSWKGLFEPKGKPDAPVGQPLRLLRDAG